MQQCVHFSELPVLPALDARIPKWSLSRLVFRSCPLCRQDNRPVLRRPDGLPIAFCNDCSVWYVASLPPSEEISRIYQGYWFSYRPKNLSDFYADSLLSDVESPQHDVRLNRLAALAGGLEGRRLLEIGCGCGELLTRARMRGAVVLGNDISSEACSFVQKKLGIPVFHGEFSSMAVSAEFGHMDIVVMSDLFEHLVQPLATFHSALDILKPDGLLLILTPNGGAAARNPGTAAKWVGFRVDLEHLQYVSTGTMSVLAEKYCCQIEHLEVFGYPALEGIDVLPVSSFASDHQVSEVTNRAFEGIVRSKLKKFRPLRKVIHVLRRFRSRPVAQRLSCPEPSLGTYHLLAILRKNGTARTRSTAFAKLGCGRVA
jgi:2-polyprenyl-3-methyl-5-hydroxy-6-metoxy-1,4-benzoquinol methylase